MSSLQLLVDEVWGGQRIDKFLATYYPSRTFAQEYISNGLVTVSGVVARKSSTIVNVGDAIVVHSCEKEEITVPNIDVVYEDDYLLVINKPSGVVSHPGPGSNDINTVTQFLLARYGEIIHGVGDSDLRPGIVHRLDKQTSGLMLVAKRQDSYVKLKEMISSRVIKRRYLTLVYGVVEPAQGVISNMVARGINHKMRVVRVSTSGARNAVTHYRIIDALNCASLLECSLETGRTHQIRLHLSHIGHGVIGDDLYGRNRFIRKSMSNNVLGFIDGMGRHWLHAHGLEFVHPFTGTPVILESDLPTMLSNCLHLLKLPHVAGK